MHEPTRRHVLAGTGVALASGALAGCLGGDDDVDDDGEGDRLMEYIEDARGFDGTVRDHTGEDPVTIANGAGDDGLSFDPAGIRIDAGTTVVWEWTGRGGAHDVASVRDSDFSFQSDRTDAQGHTFEHTFDEVGVALYECQPHRGQRMKGGIDVV